MAAAYLKDTIRQFLDGHVATLSQSSIYNYKLFLTRFLDFSGNIRLASITPALAKRFSKKFHPLAAVKALLNWATFEAKTIKENPLKGLKLPKTGRRSRIVSRIEKLRILRRSARPFRDLLVGLSESLARPAELRDAKWGDIRTSASSSFMVQDLIDGRCFFWKNNFKAKERMKGTAAFRVIPISPRFGRLLVRLWRHGRQLDQFVFANRLRQPWTSNAVRCRMRRLRVRGDFHADTNGEKIVAYTIRHSSATEAVQAGISVLSLAALMGHTDVRMTQRYVHLVPDNLLEAMNTLDAFRRGRSRKNRRTESTRNAPEVLGRVNEPLRTESPP